MTRQFRKESKLRRHPSRSEAKKEIWVVSEGTVTEPKNIKDFAHNNKHTLVDVKAIGKGGCPMTLVREAKKIKDKLSGQARKSKDSFQKRFEVWCISDRDEHPNMVSAMKEASDAGIRYSLSNPCIELWAYLHFKFHDAPTHRHQMQRLLEMEMPNYNHDRNAVFDYELMHDRYDTAISNAKRLKQNRIDEDNHNGNPSTSIYKLLESIKSEIITI